MNEIVCHIKNEEYVNAFFQFERSFESLKDAFEIETYENPSEDLFKFNCLSA